MISITSRLDRRCSSVQWAVEAVGNMEIMDAAVHHAAWEISNLGCPAASQELTTAVADDLVWRLSQL